MTDALGVMPSAFDGFGKFASIMARSNSELENKLHCSFSCVRAGFTFRRCIRPFAEQQGPGVQALRRLRSCSAAASTSSVHTRNVFNM
jgi:hypothetical protein